MSFVNTLAKVAIGFAAAKGIDKYRQMGGMAGIQAAMGQPGGSGGASMADSLGEMAEKMGMPGGRNAMSSLMSQFGMGGGGGGGGGMAGGGAGAGAGDAGMAGLGGLMAAFGGGAAAGAPATQMLEALAEKNPMTPMVEDNARLMIRAMVQAAKADGEIDADEQARILEHLGDASPEEIAYVREQLNAPLDLAGLANDTNAQARGQVYGMSLMAISLDSQAEATYLANLARALGLSDVQRTAIHNAMGVPPAPPA